MLLAVNAAVAPAVAVDLTFVFAVLAAVGGAVEVLAVAAAAWKAS